MTGMREDRRATAPPGDEVAEAREQRVKERRHIRGGEHPSPTTRRYRASVAHDRDQAAPA